METYDDDLSKFEAVGAAPLPIPNDQGYIENDGARIWYATYGCGAPVILLHGGLGNSGNWGYQVPALVGSGYRAVVIDSRGHGRSTRDERPFTYELMASDVLAVMDTLKIERAGLVGWSDGAMHGPDPGRESAQAGSRCVLFCLQYGPERGKGIQTYSDHSAMPHPPQERLRATFRHA